MITTYQTDVTERMMIMLKTLCSVAVDFLGNVVSFIWDFLHHSFAPVMLLALMLIGGSVLRDEGAYVLSAVISVACAAGMVVSFVLCWWEYGDKARRILAALCILAVLVSIGAVQEAEDFDVSYDSGNTGYTSISFTGRGSCSGCFGRGYIYCNSSYCVNGKCTSCKAGLYKHGSYYSSCIVCDGDGDCNICDGTNKVACRVCG